MSRKVSVVVGTLMIVVGAIWLGQGLGWIGGSVMSGVTVWAVIGPLVALAGVALVVRGTRAAGGPGDGRHRSP